MIGTTGREYSEFVIMPFGEGLDESQYDVDVRFASDRVDPGNQVYNTGNTPKVIGNATPTVAEWQARVGRIQVAAASDDE